VVQDDPFGTPQPDVGAYTTTMTDAVQPPSSPRDADADAPHELHDIQHAANPEAHKESQDASTLDMKALADRTLHFLATASNETLGACLVGLGAGTYFILGRVGLVLIGVVGGVVLHATWEGGSKDSEDKGKGRRELGVDVALRVLDWRDTRTLEKSAGGDDDDLSVQLLSGKTLDFSEFQPETAAALTELTDAVIRDYVKYVPSAVSVVLSNAIQVVVLSSAAFRRILPQLVPPDLHCSHPLHVRPSLPQATRRQLR
jgi:hypothetical protein